MKKIVLEILKPRVKALGFNKDELEGVAADIADNLELKEDASEEERNAAAKAAVDAVIPSLKVAQKMANRVIESYRRKQEPEPDPAPQPEPAPQANQNQPDPKPEPEGEKTPEWAKLLIASNKESAATIKALQEEINKIKSKSAKDIRKTRLEELLKDTGTFGKSTIKSFERMKFESDDEFESFYAEVKGDLEQLNQERADAGLGKFGAPVVQTDPKPEPPKVLTEAEQDEIASLM